MKKSVLCVVLTVVLVMTALSGVVAADTSDPVIRFVTKNVDLDKREVTVDVVIENNPGIVTATIPVKWKSSVLTLTGVTPSDAVLPTAYEVDTVYGKAVQGWIGMPMDQYTSNGIYYLAWDNDLAEEDYTGDGTLCTLTFAIAEGITEDSCTIEADLTAEIGGIRVANVMNQVMDDLTTDTDDAEGAASVLITAVAGEILFTEAEKLYTVSGSVTSYGDPALAPTITLTAEDGTVYTAEVNAAEKTYSVSAPAGEYTLKVEKKNHVTRTYTVLLGE